MKNENVACPNTSSPSNAQLRKFSKAAAIAGRLNLNKKTIFRWADAGRITRFKLNGRVVLFDEAEVAAVIEGGRISLPEGGGA